MRVMVLDEGQRSGRHAVDRAPRGHEQIKRGAGKAGIMVAGEGLKASSQGKRVAFDGVSRTVNRGALRRNRRARCRVLAVAGQGRGRGDRMGEALPEPDAGPKRHRDPPSL